MHKYVLAAVMALGALPSWAGSAMSSATISETLTLTSPSATLTMNGVSATAFLRNVSVTGVLSATTVSATNGYFSNVSATTYAGRTLLNYSSWSQTNLYSQNVGSVTRYGNGLIGVSFTTAYSGINNYSCTCTAQRNAATDLVCTITDSPSRTTAGINVRTINFSGTPTDGVVNLTCLGN